MKLWLGAGIFVIAVLLVGFLIGIVLPETGTICTLMACYCNGLSGEIHCNMCLSDDIVFATGVFNVINHCAMSEMATCENNSKLPSMSRIDTENKTCITEPYVFWFNLLYLFNNPYEPLSKYDEYPG